MRRRHLLAATGCALAPAAAGCLGDGDDPGAARNGTGEGNGADDGDGNGSDDGDGNGSDDGDGNGSDDGDGNGSDDGDGNGSGTTAGTDPDEYEECSHVRIRRESLPEEIRAEVDAALEAGSYETDRLLLAEAIRIEDAYVVVDDAPYEPCVEAGDETTTLELREAEVIRLPEPREITVGNRGEEARDIRVTLTDGGETIVDETVSLEPGASTDLEATDAFGSYELAGSVVGEPDLEDEFDFRVDESSFDGIVDVSGDDIVVSQDVADIAPCPWDAR